MRSINLKWLNLTLSNQSDSSTENFLKTPKIKRLEIKIVIKSFWHKNYHFRKKNTLKISSQIENLGDFRSKSQKWT